MTNVLLNPMSGTAKPSKVHTLVHSNPTKACLPRGGVRLSHLYLQVSGMPSLCPSASGHTTAEQSEIHRIYQLGAKASLENQELRKAQVLQAHWNREQRCQGIPGPQGRGKDNKSPHQFSCPWADSVCESCPSPKKRRKQ